MNTIATKFAVFVIIIAATTSLWIFEPLVLAQTNTGGTPPRKIHLNILRLTREDLWFPYLHQEITCIQHGQTIAQDTGTCSLQRVQIMAKHLEKQLS